MHLTTLTLLSLLTIISAEDFTTWTKPGARFRQVSAALVDLPTLTIIETSTSIPTATFHLRSIPKNLNIKRAYLNPWTLQGCTKISDNLPPMVSPFPYQLAPDHVSSGTCIHFCDERGNTLAALINGNECWCGENQSGYEHVDSSRCDVECAGESEETCGGKDAMTIYAKPGNR